MWNKIRNFANMAFVRYIKTKLAYGQKLTERDFEMLEWLPGNLKDAVKKYIKKMSR